MEDLADRYLAPRGTPLGMARPTLDPQNVTPPPHPKRKAAPDPAPAPPPKAVDPIEAILERGRLAAQNFFPGRIERLPARLREQLPADLSQRYDEYRATWRQYEERLDQFDSRHAFAIRRQQDEAFTADPSGLVPQPIDQIKRDLRKRVGAIDAAFRKTAVPAGLALSRDFIAAVRPLLQAELDELVKSAVAWETEWQPGAPVVDSRALWISRVLCALDSQLEQAEEQAARGQFALADCLHMLD